MPEISLTRIDPTLLEWSAFDPQVKTLLTSHAICNAGKVVLIDPIFPDAAVMAAISEMGMPCGIFLTNGNHERASKKLSKLLNIPVASPAFAVKEFSFKPDIILDGLTQIYGFKPIAIPGAGLGEHALYCTKTQTLCVGDALVNLPTTGLAILPDKYCLDAALLKKSLRALTLLKIQTLIFSHGSPMYHPMPALKKLIGT